MSVVWWVLLCGCESEIGCGVVKRRRGCIPMSEKKDVGDENASAIGDVDDDDDASDSNAKAQQKP